MNPVTVEIDEPKCWQEINECYNKSELDEINQAFKELIHLCHRIKSENDKSKIKKAYLVALHAHRNQRRKSGEPFVYHPIEVARIIGYEIGLGPTTIACALIHDVVEDNNKEYPIEVINELFGVRTTLIIKGLTKVKQFKTGKSLQVEAMMNMLFNLSEDIKVIFIKIADRLHNMRTLEHMRENKRLEKASETLFIYAPLAHKLCLYSIRTELENLSFFYREPFKFAELKKQADNKQKEFDSIFTSFTEPISNALNRSEIYYSFDARQKSLYTTYRIMQRDSVDFEGVHNFSAVRIVFSPLSLEDERVTCYRIYAMVSNIYQQKENSIRDSVNNPRSNGFEALIFDVMGPSGKWIEVQVMSKRMNELADKGIAAINPNKKQNFQQKVLDNWISSVNRTIKDTETESLEILDDFKLSLFTSEILVFTPRGEQKRLPKGATVLDFAFNIHSKLGLAAVQARVNHQITEIDHELKSSDQVEIITSSSHIPSPDYLSFVKTTKAKYELRKYFRERENKQISIGLEILKKTCVLLEIDFPDEEKMNHLCKIFEVATDKELSLRIQSGSININTLKKELKAKTTTNLKDYWFPNIFKPKSTEEIKLSEISTKERLVLSSDDVSRYEIAKCCSPVPNEETMGYITEQNKIIIHEKSCQEAIRLSSSDAKHVVPVYWEVRKEKSFLKNIYFKGIDRFGLVNEISDVVTSQLNLSINKIYFETVKGGFVGELEIYVHDIQHLRDVIAKVKSISGVSAVSMRKL